MTGRKFYHPAIIIDTLAMTDSENEFCNAPLHPQAAQGLRLFNARQYFEAHEALEDAWNDEKGKVRDLYRGILQIAVVYLHITRGNYNGAIKVFGRSQRWLKDWPDTCRGIDVGSLRMDAQAAINEVKRLGEAGMLQFDHSLLKPITWNQKHIHTCDRCGHQMYEKNCKVTCPNCGNRFDCSDLNIYFD